MLCRLLFDMSDLCRLFSSLRAASVRCCNRCLRQDFREERCGCYTAISLAFSSLLAVLARDCLCAYRIGGAMGDRKFCFWLCWALGMCVVFGD